jgi:hypothetical protein
LFCCMICVINGEGDGEVRIKRGLLPIVSVIVIFFTVTNLSFAQDNTTAEDDTTKFEYPALDYNGKPCEEYTKADVSKNVDSLIQNLFSRKKPTVGEVEGFYEDRGKSAEENFLSAEVKLGIAKCLHKWKVKNWELLSEKQKNSCGDLSGDSNESLFYKKLRLKTGAIEKYSIDKITFIREEDNFTYYKALVKFKKLGNAKKTSLEIYHKHYSNCFGEGDWMYVWSINGKLIK